MNGNNLLFKMNGYNNMLGYFILYMNIYGLFFLVYIKPTINDISY